MEFRRGVSKLNAHIRPLVKRTSEDDSETVRLVVTAHEVSWEMQVGKQARHTHYSSSMRFFLMSFERGGQSGDCLGGSPL